MTGKPPFTTDYDLASLPEKGAELVLDPGAAERAQIASWLGVEAVERLVGTIRLIRSVSGRYMYHAHLDADVVQACVVTLEPIHSHLSEDFERCFELAAPMKQRHKRERSIVRSPSEEISMSDADGDTPERIDSTIIDLAAPLLEELSLSLDPYPRKAGVAFTAPEDLPGALSDHPFAVLQKLKRP